MSLEYFPDASRATNNIGCSPLHYACNNPNVTLNIIQLLIDAAPDSVRSEDNDDWMPLHMLCANRKVDEAAEMKILKLLIEKCPQAVRHEDNGGVLPIHIAARTRSPEFCRLLIEAYPRSEQIPDADGLLPLHIARMANTVATVEYMLKRYLAGINIATTDGFYPIHCAIEGIIQRDNTAAAIDIVKFLLDCNPNVKVQKGPNEESLLEHVLLHHDSNVRAARDMITVIFDEHPEDIEDNNIISNIHSFHQNVQPFINSQLVYSRQAKDRRLMTTPDSNGYLPLHRALQNNVRLGSIKLLVKGNPSAIRNSNNNFAMPLHIACEHHDSASVVEHLLDLDTRTLRATDIDNNTALHHACRGAKYQTIALLLESFDAVSLSKRNANKKLPIDLLWESNAVKDRESVEYVDIVFRLLKAYPDPEMLTISNVTMKRKIASKKHPSKKRAKQIEIPPGWPFTNPNPTSNNTLNGGKKRGRKRKRSAARNTASTAAGNNGRNEGGNEGGNEGNQKRKGGKKETHDTTTSSWTCVRCKCSNILPRKNCIICGTPRCY